MISGFAEESRNTVRGNNDEKRDLKKQSSIQLLVDAKLHKNKSVNLEIFGPAFVHDNKIEFLGFRVELWYDGQLAGYKDSMSKQDLDKNELPEDWYIFNKYPDKIQYDPALW